METEKRHSTHLNAHTKINGYLLAAPISITEDMNIIKLSYWCDKSSIDTPILLYFEGYEEPTTVYPNKNGIYEFDNTDLKQAILKRVFVRETFGQDFSLDYTILK